MCTNEECPYRHVFVNPKAPICEGFLKGFCLDGDEVTFLPFGFYHVNFYMYLTHIIDYQHPLILLSVYVQVKWFEKVIWFGHFMFMFWN